MKRLFLTLLILCVASVSFRIAAQRIVSVSGEDTYYAPSTMSLEQAKQEALLQAKIRVLAAKFGTTISSTTNIHVENREGADARSKTEVQTLSMNEVKGEWLEDTRPAVQEIYYDKSMPNTTIIRTQVWGKAREVTVARAEIEVHLLKDTVRGSDAEVFSNEQSFYLSVQSPVAGYLAVYLLDQEDEAAYCLLPATADHRGAVTIDSNTRYVFFSEDYARRHYSAADQVLGTEYMFITGRSVLFNQIRVIFSPNEFFKATDRQEQDSRYNLPRETSIPAFNKWLVGCKTRDPQLVDQPLTVKIVK